MLLRRIICHGKVVAAQNRCTTKQLFVMTSRNVYLAVVLDDSLRRADLSRRRLIAVDAAAPPAISSNALQLVLHAYHAVLFVLLASDKVCVVGSCAITVLWLVVMCDACVHSVQQSTAFDPSTSGTFCTLRHYCIF